jgi:hypothetical protein
VDLPVDIAMAEQVAAVDESFEDGAALAFVGGFNEDRERMFPVGRVSEARLGLCLSRPP